MSKMLGKDLAQSMKQYMDALEEMSNEAEHLRDMISEIKVAEFK